MLPEILNVKYLPPDQFLCRLVEDIRRARHSVVICSPNVDLRGSSALVEALREVLQRGVKVHIVTRFNQEIPNLPGVCITQVPGLGLRAVVIDDEIVYTGPLDPLASAQDVRLRYDQVPRYMLRIVDKTYAGRILQSLR